MRQQLVIDLLRQGRPKEALKRLTHFPDTIETLVLRAAAWERVPDATKALGCWVAVTERNPDMPVAWAALTKLNRVANRRQDALLCANQWCRVAPRDPYAWCNLAEISAQFNQQLDAKQAFLKAVDVAPKQIDVLAAAGAHFISRADYEIGLRLMRKGLEAEPNNPAFVGGYAMGLQRAGKWRRAFRFMEALESAPADVHYAAAAARVYKHAKRPEAALPHLRAAQALTNLTTERRALLEHNLGVTLEAVGDYDGAFEAHTTGNKVRPDRWRREDYERSVDNTLPWWREFRGRQSKHMDRSLIFILGMPRSGTTLLESVLTMNLGVAAAGECANVYDVADAIARTQPTLDSFRHVLTELESETWDRLHVGTMKRYRDRFPDAERIVDKMPFNFARLDVIAQLFPGAKVIYSNRHPYDNCLSCYFQNFASDLSFTHDLGDLGHYWRQHARYIEAAKNLPIEIMEVKYEDMVADLEGTTKSLMSFLELPWTPDCLNFHENTRQAATASYDQVRQPLYRSSVGRWRRYMKHLDPLFEQLPLSEWAPDVLSPA